jgi:hypothetical protein
MAYKDFLWSFNIHKVLESFDRSRDKYSLTSKKTLQPSFMKKKINNSYVCTLLIVFLPSLGEPLST